MEQTCDRLLELDHAGFTATHVFGGSGSYDGFKAARAARRHAQANAAADARTLLRRESEWMARQPKVTLSCATAVSADILCQYTTPLVSHCTVCKVINANTMSNNILL